MAGAVNYDFTKYGFLQIPLLQQTTIYKLTKKPRFRFFKTRIDDSTQFNIPLTTTKQVEENMKPIRGNKAMGLDGFGIKIIKLALPAISLKAQLTL